MSDLGKRTCQAAIRVGFQIVHICILLRSRLHPLSRTKWFDSWDGIWVVLKLFAAQIGDLVDFFSTYNWARQTFPSDPGHPVICRCPNGTGPVDAGVRQPRSAPRTRNRD